MSVSASAAAALSAFTPPVPDRALIFGISAAGKNAGACVAARKYRRAAPLRASGGLPSEDQREAGPAVLFCAVPAATMAFGWAARHFC